MNEQAMVGPPITNDPLTVVKGGWDGVVVSFGDDCDDDTFNSIYGALERGRYNLRVTRIGGQHDDGSIASTITENVILVNSGHSVETGVFRLLLEHTEDGAPVGDVYAVEFDDILSIHIY